MTAFYRPAAVCLTLALAFAAARADAPDEPLPPGAVARLGSARLRHAANGLAWAPDGKTFVSAGADGFVHVWDADDGREVRRLQQSLSGPLNSVVYLPDGRLAACGGEGAIHVFDEATGREVRTVTVSFQATARLAAGPDEGTVATIGFDNVCRVVDLTTGKVVRQLEGARGVRLPRAALSADGRRFAVWSAAAPADLLTVWDVAGGKELFHAPTPLKQVGDLAFSPDGKTLAASGFQQHFAAWDVDTGKELRTYEAVGSVNWLTFTPNGKYVAAECPDRAIHLWGVASGKELRQFDISPWNFGTGPGSGVMAFSPDGKTLAVALGSAIRLWDVETGKERREFTGHFAAVGDLRFSPDGRRLLSCGKEPVARLWDVAAAKQIASWNYTQGTVLVMVASPDGKSVVAPTGAGIVRVELGEDKNTEKILAPLTTGIFVYSLAVSPDGKMLAGAGQDRVLRFWDAETGKTTWRPPSDPGGGVPVLAFSPDGRLLASASVNAPVRLWDVAAGKEALQLDDGAPPAAVRPGFPPGAAGTFRNVSYLAFSPDGRELLCVAGGELSLWETATGRDRMRIARPAVNFTHAAFSPAGDLVAAGTASGEVLLLDAAHGDEVGRLAGPRGVAVASLVFAPDGKTLATGGADGGILIWDVKGRSADVRPAAADFKPEKLSSLWQDLIDVDAARAYRAELALAAAPKAAAPYLEGRLAGVEGGDEKRIARLIVELDDDQFDAREKAQKELEELGDLAVSALRKALDSNPPAETRRRAVELLDKHKSSAAVTEEVRDGRALEALERSGAPEALEALEALRALAKDAPNTGVRREAAAALERLARRADAP